MRVEQRDAMHVERQVRPRQVERRQIRAAPGGGQYIGVVFGMFLAVGAARLHHHLLADVLHIEQLAA